MTVLDLIGPAAVIAECDENLCGTNLSKAERALFTKHRKAAYIALHPETKAHVAGAHAANRSMGNAAAKLAIAFTADTAAKTIARSVISAATHSVVKMYLTMSLTR